MGVCACVRIFCWFVHFPVLVLFFCCCYFIASISVLYAWFYAKFQRFLASACIHTNSICKSFDVKMSLVCTCSCILKMKARREAAMRKRFLSNALQNEKRRVRERERIKNNGVKSNSMQRSAHIAFKFAYPFHPDTHRIVL